MRTKSKGVRRYSSDETLEGHETVRTDHGVCLVGVNLHLINGTNSSALVHVPLDEDVFFRS